MLEIILAIDRATRLLQVSSFPESLASDVNDLRARLVEAEMTASLIIDSLKSSKTSL